MGREPTPTRQYSKAGGYDCWFYGGWVSKVTVRRGGEVTEVYAQKESFVLPAGADQPFTLCQTEIQGLDLPRFTVTLDDPHHVVDRIEVVLKRRTENGGGDQDDGDDDDRVILSNSPALCPPHC